MAKPKHRTKRNSVHSPLSAHARDGKKLVPPFLQMPKIQFLSWRDDRLPDVLWQTIIATQLERDVSLQLFRDIARNAQALNLVGEDPLSHTGLATLSDEAFDKLLSPALTNTAASTALSALNLLEQIPDRIHWLRHLAPPDEAVGFEVLRAAIGKCFDHQSQESTDCRWLFVLSMLLLDKARMPDEPAERILGYPNVGDQRSVRPSIRSMEIAFRTMPGGKPHAWPVEFWREAWTKTECLPAQRWLPEEQKEIEPDNVAQLYHSVAEHFRATSKGTMIDPRHDGVFGIALYAISVVVGVLANQTDSEIEGRWAIRTITECYVSLSYLLQKDTEQLWSRFRQHGSGQAKLAFLKLHELEGEDVPKYVDVRELEFLASEDVWQEFSEIDLGQWAKSDLRRMSEEAKVKEVYDRYYAWPSGYVHGQWGAVRDTVFHLCLNPLHRYHRIPSLPRRDMGSVAADLRKLLNLTLERVNQAYPTFKPRLVAKKAPDKA